MSVLGRNCAGCADKTGTGAIHLFVVSVITETRVLALPRVAAAVCDVLHDADLTLDRGRLVSVRFERARATDRQGRAARS